MFLWVTAVWKIIFQKNGHNFCDLPWQHHLFIVLDPVLYVRAIIRHGLLPDSWNLSFSQIYFHLAALDTIFAQFPTFTGNEWALEWRHNEHDGVTNHRRLDSLPKRLFVQRSKKTSKLRVTGLCEGNTSVTGGFPSQRASSAENCFHLMTSLCSCSWSWSRPKQSRWDSNPWNKHHEPLAKCGHATQ